MSFPVKIPAEWRRPAMLLFLLTAGMGVSTATFMALFNNYAFERAAFTGVEIGVLHTLREVPGLLAFTVIFVLLVIREQRLAVVSLVLLGVGTALIGLFPNVAGIYAMAVLGSIGFHYFEALRQSLVLQWIDKERTPHVMGQLIAVGSFASLATYGGVYVLLEAAAFDMTTIFLVGGGLAAALALAAGAIFPDFQGGVVQRRHIVLRRRYWLFYALTFLSGARRQIVMVFAAFLMVERFSFGAEDVTLMLLANYAINIVVAPRIGKLITRWGERRALMLEYVGLIGVFTAYAFVEQAGIAVGLFILDHVFFSMAIAIKTYFQKIADPADMANTAGVSSTINHLAAVFLPAVLGLVWVTSPSTVFLIGTGFAVTSLIAASLIPRTPEPGNEVVFGSAGARAAAGHSAASRASSASDTFGGDIGRL